MSIETAHGHTLDGQELAGIIRTFREMRRWSQDTLAVLSKLSIRTVQRVESGEVSSPETRRALAIAFELEEIDFFNKPLIMPNPERMRAEVEKIKRENVTMEARIVGSGQELVRLFESVQMDSFSSAVELHGVAAEAFAGLVDYLRDYRDCADLMSETQKLTVFDEVQGYMDALRKAGFSISHARRDTRLVGRDWADKTSWEVSIAYLVVFPKGSEPKIICAPRQVRF
ncbi:helix-turn-helix domain-containing protein [Paludibaculum fermentans]|uniref:Helix-turn-helix transcriptional regulator n=1 Tax=Paludibaculum fermentans TaxID=1473598 RepID=A0A7S7NWB0_PALFE|nr:helix-turn-helix transcriptional regulator [Paludibaculum fermentans]QOY90374.1 helix-turn-helix transcriptional regulator [Paludibaculum fermentans]